MVDQYGRRLEIITLFPRHVTSSAHEKKPFQTYYTPQGFIAVAFIFLELDRGWGLPAEAVPYLLVQKVEKKPGLDRVKQPSCM